MKAVERVLARSIRQQVNTDRQLGFVEGKGIHWVISHFGLVLRSAILLSETAVIFRLQGVIIVGPQKYFIVIILKQKGVMQMSVNNNFGTLIIKTTGHRQTFCFPTSPI